MQIKLGKYVVKSDAHQFILYEEVIAEESGKLRLANPRYYPRLEQLVKALLEVELKTSEAESIRELTRALMSVETHLIHTMENLHGQSDN